MPVAFGRAGLYHSAAAQLTPVRRCGIPEVIDLVPLPGEQTRVTHAMAAPARMDAQVVNNLAAMLARCRRLDDTLGPSAVLGTVPAQHELVHHLLAEGMAEQWHTPLRVLDSSAASAIGHYLFGMGNLDAARGWINHARKAGHASANPAHAAYAAANLADVAKSAGDTPPSSPGVRFPRATRRASPVGARRRSPGPARLTPESIRFSAKRFTA